MPFYYVVDGVMTNHKDTSPIESFWSIIDGISTYYPTPKVEDQEPIQVTDVRSKDLKPTAAGGIELS